MNSTSPIVVRTALQRVTDVGTSDKSWSASSTVRDDCTFHQLAPYIGRMKTAMARALVLDWTAPGDLVVDPFCGCGVVALEAGVNGRRVAAGDWNPYAALLTRAKLFAPPTQADAEARLGRTWNTSRELLANQDLRKVPAWVRAFFHSGTLKNALAFRDACTQEKEWFLLACLLGILHHQRPGFLSFPSSHLVPYLRDRSFPKRTCPEMYLERDVLPRLAAKVKRLYRRAPAKMSKGNRVFQVDACAFPSSEPIGTVLTSPPYMNELDYVRDNRLRLWFISRSIPSGLELRGRNREGAYRNLMTSVCGRLGPQIKPGGRFILVVGEATRGGGRIGRTADITQEIFSNERALKSFRLEKVFTDTVPDIRRSRRECKGTRLETVLIYRNACD